MASTKLPLNIKVSELLKKLPLAATLRLTSAASPAALERKRQYDERSISRNDYNVRNTRIIGFIKSYAEYLIGVFDSKYKEAEKGYGWVTIEQAYPPLTEEVEGVRVYKHESTKTHWSGVDEQGNIIDPTENGVPKVMLLQGPRSSKPDASGRRDYNPKDLPGGKSTVDIMRESLSLRGYNVNVSYSRGTVNVTVIWDHYNWDRHQEYEQKQRSEHNIQYQKNRVEASTQVSYADYRAQKAARSKKPEEVLQ